MIVVSAPGNYGKPRRAVVVQSDAIPGAHGSVIVCQMTSDLVDASDFRIDIEPTVTNGLKLRSQILVDKPVAVRRERVGAVVGAIESSVVRRLDVAIAFVMGLADR